jgi:predicted nucleotidyltransferase
MDKPKQKIVLLGVTGSQAHGLAHPDSDIDMRGVFIYPTEAILGLPKFCGKDVSTSTVDDVVLYEVGKFVSLALAANPSILELLFLPEYGCITDEGRLLVVKREAFLSQKVRQTYGGYATQQYKRLVQREQAGMVGFGPKTSKRREKHARHLARLLLQGQQLLTEGTLTVKLSKAQRKIVRAAEKLSTEDLGKFFADEMAHMDEIKSSLPEEPDYELVNYILLEMRRDNY